MRRTRRTPCWRRQRRGAWVVLVGVCEVKATVHAVGIGLRGSYCEDFTCSPSANASCCALLAGGYSRLRSGAEAGHLVLHGAALVAVRAVVVARQDVRVHVAQADPVIAVLVARVDAALVPADAGVDDVLRGAVGSQGGGGEARGSEEDESGTHGEQEVRFGITKLYKKVTMMLPKRVVG